MQRLVYTVDIDDELYVLDYVLVLLDTTIQSETECDVHRSKLESLDEIIENGEWEAEDHE